ncbi:hypothetical protein [Kineococcus sp. SYSU DK003]|uniref:hypothetical protein n=1 Tax=Kineococcus sp. SYSU DK003 TaxID=3383124 RepID=UPI003D7C6E95
MRAPLALAAARGAGHRAGALLRHNPPGGAERWDRTNHAGRTVTLLEGPTVALALAAGCLATAPGTRAAAVLAAVGAGGFGALDDLTERAGDRDAGARGLRGHLAALRRGRVTTGAVKVLGIGATGVLAAVVLDRPRTPAQVVDTALAGALVAGSANLLNLFDLRPGRAAKVATVVAASLSVGAPGSAGAAAARPPAAAVVGACSAVLPDDLAGRSMLGDTGANALGAVLGVAALRRWRRPGRAVALGVVVALTLASERISFSRVVEAVPVLRELDRLGRP